MRNSHLDNLIREASGGMEEEPEMKKVVNLKIKINL